MESTTDWIWAVDMLGSKIFTFGPKSGPAAEAGAASMSAPAAATATSVRRASRCELIRIPLLSTRGCGAMLVRQTKNCGHRDCVKTIVVGYDASDAAQRVLDRAAELAEALAARLVVVSVSEPPVPPTAPVLEPTGPMLVPGGATGTVLTGGTVPLAEPEPDPKELAQRRLDEARSRLDSRSLEADYVAEVGAPAERMLVVADERDAELIVVGHGEHGFLERLVMQPVEEAVARRGGRGGLIVHLRSGLRGT